MTHRFPFVFAAALLMGGVALTSRAQVQDPARTDPIDRTGTAGRQAADRVTAPDAEDIRDVIAQVTEASVTKGGFDDLVERFVDADRNRLGQSGIPERDDPQLDGIIELFLKNWKAKYNQDFDIKDEDTLFGESFVVIMQGEIGDAARLARERQEGVAPGEKPAVPPGPEADKVAGGDTNREPGRNVATVIVQPSHGMPQATVFMIHELPDSWKVDLADSYSAQQLRDNLANCLTKLNENQAQWPTDVNEAYRKVTHKVLLVVSTPDMTIIEKEKDHIMPGQPGQDR